MDVGAQGGGPRGPSPAAPPPVCVCRPDETYCGAWDCIHKHPLDPKWEAQPRVELKAAAKAWFDRDAEALDTILGPYQEEA